MLNDSHIHVGQFREIYTSPRELVDFLDCVGVNHFAVSSTTIWEENYGKVLSEMRELLSLTPNRVSPVLWISPAMLENGGLQLFFESGINWKCIKVHGVHPWEEEGLLRCVEVARQLRVPLLFHTGGFEQCDAGVYLPIIKNNPDVIFILAHARPVDQAVMVMQQCSNAWADTAFAPVDTVLQLMNAGMENRVLYGTDTPLQKIYYSTFDWKQIYLSNIANIQKALTNEQWEKIAYVNYNKLFKHN